MISMELAGIIFAVFCISLCTYIKNNIARHVISIALVNSIALLCLYFSILNEEEIAITLLDWRFTEYWIINLTTNSWVGSHFAVLASSLWLLTYMYSVFYFAKNQEKAKDFYLFVPISILACIGISFAGNLFTLFIFYEILTFSTYPLVVMLKNKESYNAGKVYLMQLVTPSLLCFLPVVIMDNMETPLVSDDLKTILFILGITKTALLPFNQWLTRAMVAPVPVSALLHAVAVVKAGVFSIFIYFYLVQPEITYITSLILTALCLSTIVYAGIRAVFAVNIKQILAFSTISQLAIAVLPMAVIGIDDNLASNALSAGIGHAESHSIGKILLFFIAGYLFNAFKIKEIYDIKLLQRSGMFSIIGFLLAASSIIGFPYTIGGESKKQIMSLFTEFTHEYIAVYFVLIFSSLLSVFYFGRIIYYGIFASLKNYHGKRQRLKFSYLYFIVVIILIISLIF